MAGTASTPPHQRAAPLRPGVRQEKLPGQLLEGRTARCPFRSDCGLFGDFQSVIHLDAEIPHGRLQLGVTEQQNPFYIPPDRMLREMRGRA